MSCCYRDYRHQYHYLHYYNVHYYHYYLLILILALLLTTTLQKPCPPAIDLLTQTGQHRTLVNPVCNAEVVAGEV